MKSTIRHRVLGLLQDAKEPFTATTICELVSIGPEHVKLSTLSSTLKKMYDDGLLIRTEGYGPRGGYGYSLSYMKA